MADPKDIFTSHTQVSEEEQWISLSDLMTGLMMIFMLIAIAYMVRQEADLTRRETERFKLKQVAEIYDQVRRELYDELMREFGKDLPVWDAEITPDLAFRFKNPDILFNTGKAELKPKFQNILSDFFPRYTRIITQDKYDGTIKEVRIEGHTSSRWLASATPEQTYFLNMELSQSRTRSTLRYVLGQPAVADKAEWLRKHLTANGLSSSQLITKPDGTEDVERSQRVEFHIRTDAEAWLSTIKQELQ